MLNTAANAAPRYILILFPGAAGVVHPHMEYGELVYSMRTNFLLRARSYFVDEEFATVATNATPSKNACKPCWTICTDVSPPRAFMS